MPLQQRGEGIFSHYRVVEAVINIGKSLNQRVISGPTLFVTGSLPASELLRMMGLFHILRFN
jgi:hypothetical protein